MYALYTIDLFDISDMRTYNMNIHDICGLLWMSLRRKGLLNALTFQSCATSTWRNQFHGLLLQPLVLVILRTWSWLCAFTLLYFTLLRGCSDDNISGRTAAPTYLCRCMLIIRSSSTIHSGAALHQDWAQDTHQDINVDRFRFPELEKQLTGFYFRFRSIETWSDSCAKGDLTVCCYVCVCVRGERWIDESVDTDFTACFIT